MTTQTEALKLALEALEDNQHLIADNERHAYVMEYNELIEKCKEALAQPEQCKYGQEPKSCTSSPMDCQCAIDATLAQPEQEQIATWLEKECDEQYLADRVRAGDYAKEKGHTENCAALADNTGKCHLSPSLVGVGEKDYMAQPKEPEQEPVACVAEVSTYDGYLRKEVVWNKRIDSFSLGTRFYTTPPQRKPDHIEDNLAMVAQPEQEPVAWGMPSAGEGHIVDVITPEEHDRVEGGYTVPLYTTPPQRTWVGLTDEERKAIRAKAAEYTDITDWNYTKRVQEATELALQEKNK